VTRPRPSRSARGLAVIAVALAALTACGGDDGGDAAATTSAAAPTAEESATDAAQGQALTATEGEMFIELSTEELSAGTYTIEVVNDGSATHDFVVERDGDDVAGTDTIAPGSSTTLEVDLEPGEYVFYCSVGNHRDMGMEVTVTVS
jgi:plastocyanin